MRLVLFLFPVLVFLSCQVDRNNEKQSGSSMKVLKGRVGENIDSNIKIDSGTFEVVKLKGVSDYLSEFDEFKVRKGNFYGLASEKIYCFNDQGVFKFKIDKMGKGPGEYLSIKDFHVDEDGQIAILDHQANKIAKYDQYGQFVDEIFIGISGFTFGRIDKDLWAIYVMSSISNKTSSRLNIFSESKNKIVGDKFKIKKNSSRLFSFHDLSKTNYNEREIIKPFPA
ncbi:hypothetical protein FUAX_10130 [Fulvitalea axinellae]|uniref:6-bladed beta-propeller n=1 Tax=Fulvitalea axinellae TaxID=1182444 RepID=A0AAU9CI76_9BACT|nr:hypothetical protein FUAX_10130 [Fulvitalea axinellae]